MVYFANTRGPREPTPLEGLLDAACRDAGVQLSAPIVYWNPTRPNKLLLSRGTPWQTGDDRMLLYLRELSIPQGSKPQDVLPELLSAGIPGVETIIDSTMTSEGTKQSTYTAQCTGKRWRVTKPNDKVAYLDKSSLIHTLQRIVERYRDSK